MIVDAIVEEEDLLQFEGICNENAPQFQRTKTIEITIAIDPDTAPDGRGHFPGWKHAKCMPINCERDGDTICGIQTPTKI